MKNKALIALITIVVGIFGSLALTGLQQELAPSIQFPRLAVLTNYPGASPDVVNIDVSTPIETAIQGVPGVESTQATSSTNLSLISVTFVYGTNLGTAEQKIDQAINRIKQVLPDTVDPQVVSGSIDDLPVLQLAVTGDAAQNELAAQLRQSTLGEIEHVAGVREAALIGAVGSRVTITPDPKKLTAAGLSTTDIRTALGSNGALTPAGTITEDEKTLSVQAGTRLGSVADVAALPLIPSMPQVDLEGLPVASAPLTIGDVGTVALTDDPQTSISRVNGEPALTIAITKLPAANTVEVSQAVLEILPALQAELGHGAVFTTVFDQAPYIQQSIAALTEEGLLGLLFAVIVILIFLMSVRSTLVTAISIPTSVLITFIGLQAFGYSLNIITLGALTIAIGRVVDDSIVVIENIKRHLGQNPPRLSDSVKQRADTRASVIVEAVREVAGAITASTITTVAVFLPISFVQGTTGELFRPFALTVTVALLASLVVSLTIVPVLAYWFLTERRKQRLARLAASRPADESPAVLVAATANVSAQGASASGPEHEQPLPARRQRRAASAVDDEGLAHPTRLQRGYLPIITWTLKHGVTTIILAVLVLGGTIALVPSMKTNFLGSTGQNTFTVTQTLAAASSLDALDTAARAVESELRAVAGVETVQLSIGSSGSSLRDAFGGGGQGTITYSITTDESADQDALQADVRERLAALPDAGEIEVGVSSGFGASSDIEIDVRAANQADLKKASDAVLASVSKLDSITQATSNLSESRPYLAVSVDRQKAADAGLSEVAVSNIVAQAMQPTQVGQVVIDERTTKIYLATKNPPATEAELTGLTVPTRTGPVALDTVATVKTVDGPSTITTVRGQRSATVAVTPMSDDLGTASSEVQSAVDSAALPSGATASLGGVTADQDDAFQQLGIALLIAILIVYIVMVATFKSLLQPLLLLVSVPFAATGAIGLQVISGIPLGVPSLIGVLMLIGIVVTNAIVLVDLVNQYRARGMRVHEALVLGASRRLRPILMTALATIFALVPMAVGWTGQGGFISQPLALVVIGGLVSSTALTLVVLPVLYLLVEGARERRHDRNEERDLAARTAAERADAAPAEATVQGS